MWLLKLHWHFYCLSSCFWVSIPFSPLLQVLKCPLESPVSVQLHLFLQLTNQAGKLPLHGPAQALWKLCCLEIVLFKERYFILYFN